MYFQLRLSSSTGLYIQDAAAFQAELGDRISRALRERSDFLDDGDLVSYLGENLEPVVLARSHHMSVEVDVISDYTIVAIVAVPSLDYVTPTRH